MLRVFLVIFCALFSVESYAEDYVERMIREKRESAERQRALTIQKIQHRQSNPEAFLAQRVAPAEKSVSFKAASDGHFYVPAKINNKNIKFLADTGATSIFISQSDAKKVGINIHNLNYNLGYTTANGATGKAAMAKAKKLQVGSIVLNNVPVTVSQEKSHMALLGMEFFKRVSKYGVEKGKLTIYK